MSRLPRWTAGGLVTILVSLSAVYVHLAVARPGGPDGMSDLHVYLGGVRNLLDGGSLYAFVAANGDRFVYPPFAALVLVPLAVLPEAGVRVLWTLGQCGVAVALAWVVVVRSSQPRLLALDRRVAVPLVACLLLLTQPVFTGLFLGQISLLVTLLALLDALDLTPHRLRGVPTGLAAAIKLTPLVFVPYLWLTGRRRAAVTAALTFVGAGVLAGLVLPADSRAHWTGVLHPAGFVDLAQVDNQSLRGLVERLGWSGNLTSLGLVAACLALAVVGYRRSRSLHQQGAVLAGAVSVGALALLVSPVSWSHHQTVLVLAAACALSSHPAVNGAWAAVVVAAMSAFVQLPLLFVGPQHLLVDNLPLFLAVFLVCGLTAPAPGPPRPPRGGAEPPRTAVAGVGPLGAAARVPILTGLTRRPRARRTRAGR